MRWNLYAIPRIALGAGSSFSAALAVGRLPYVLRTLADRLEGILFGPEKMKALHRPESG